MQPKSIALVGPMGSGKSAVAAILARRLDWQLADLDAEVERRAGMSIAEIFARDGEPAFRTLESALLGELLANERTVLATGGGCVLDPGNRALLRSTARSVWLQASVPARSKRLVTERLHRPLLHDHDLDARLQELDAIRMPFYAEVAMLEVDTSALTASEVAFRIENRLRQMENA